MCAATPHESERGAQHSLQPRLLGLAEVLSQCRVPLLCSRGILLTGAAQTAFWPYKALVQTLSLYGFEINEVCL